MPLVPDAPDATHPEGLPTGGFRALGEGTRFNGGAHAGLLRRHDDEAAVERPPVPA